MTATAAIPAVNVLATGTREAPASLEAVDHVALGRQGR